MNLDNNFWDLYEQALNLPKTPVQKSLGRDTNLAINKLQLISKTYPNLPEDLNQFVLDLLDDIQNYGSISTFTISSISKIRINDVQNIIEDLKEIKSRLGDNYFEKIKKETAHNKEKEIIISIMNKNLI